MRTRRIVPAVALMVGSSVAVHALPAQQPGVTRTDVQRHDLSVSGREVVQVRVEFAKGVAFPRHSHPGEEVAYVLTGTLEYQIDGRPPVTLQAGDAVFIPAGAIHTARNVGPGAGSELATYIVQKGKPLVVIAQVSRHQ
jgi:quercetin dioxygenase-like cupin family protein